MSPKHLQITPINAPKLYKKILKEIGELIVKEGKFDYKNRLIKMRSPLATRQIIARVYLHLIDGTEEIVNNLNYVLEHLDSLINSKGISRIDRMQKLTFFTRIFFYEYARTEDVFNIFFDSLYKLKEISKDGKLQFREFFYQQLKLGISARNALIHSDEYNLSEDELYLSVLSLSERFGRKKASLQGDLRKFDELFLKTARKRIITLRAGGNQLSSLCQMLIDTSNAVFTEMYPAPNSNNSKV